VFSTLENLPESQRELAKVSSVIGSQFRLGELRALLPSTIDRVTLHHDLRGLVSARLISLKSAGVDDQYAFQQKLVRDILYNSLPYARRRDLHAKLAAYLSEPPEQRGKLQALTSFLDASIGNPINDAKIVAYHYELAEKWFLATQNLARAADLTAEQGSHVEAAQIYERAISNLEKASSTDDTISLRQDLYAKRGDMAVLCADYAGAEAAYKTALASHSEEHHERVRTLKRKLALVLPILGQADDAQKLIRDVLEQEETQPNLTSVVTMTWLLWREDDEQTTSWIEKSKALLPEHSNSWSERIEILLNDMDAKWEAVISAYRMLEQPNAAVMAGLRLGDRHLANGSKEEAQKQYKKAARILERLKNQDCGLALVHYRMAEVSWKLDDQDAARNHLESAQALLVSCPTDIRKEGRTIIMEALKIFKKDLPLVWPTWRWQLYDDEIKIGLLFQA
jgi:predicted ATPase